MLKFNENTSRSNVSSAHYFVALLLAGCAGLYVTSIIKGSPETVYVGYLEAHRSEIKIDRNSAIAQWHVAEGDVIEQGDHLLDVQDVQLNSEIIQKEAELREIEESLRHAFAKAELEKVWRLKMLETEIHETKIEAAQFINRQFQLKLEKLAIIELEKEISSNPSVAQSAFVPVAEMLKEQEAEQMQQLLKQEANENSLEAVNTQVEICEQRIIDLQELKKEIPQKISQLFQLDELSTKKQRLQSEIKTLQESASIIPIHADTYGIVSNLKQIPGVEVEEGESFGALLDIARRHLNVQVPSSDIHRFINAEDNKVYLSFSGGSERTGLIESIPPATTRDQVAGNTQEKIITVKVIPVGKLWPRFPIGSQVLVRLQK